MRKHFRLIVLLFATLGMMFSFQNCGNTGFLKTTIMESAYNSSIDIPFEYPYPAAPKVYFDSVVTVPTDAVATDRFANIEFVGAMTPADGSYSVIQYTLEIRNQDNVRICPQQVGSLTGDTDIHFTCVTTGGPAQSIKVWAEITFEGATFILEKSFR
jgi:hypothetical protein